MSWISLCHLLSRANLGRRGVARRRIPSGRAHWAIWVRNIHRTHGLRDIGFPRPKRIAGRHASGNTTGTGTQRRPAGAANARLPHDSAGTGGHDGLRIHLHVHRVCASLRLRRSDFRRTLAAKGAAGLTATTTTTTHDHRGSLLNPSPPAYYAAFMSSKGSPRQPATRQKAQLMSASEIERTLVRLVHAIIEKNDGAKALGLVGSRRRGVFLAQRIGKMIERIEKIQVPVGTLDITLYRDDLNALDHLPDALGQKNPTAADP